MRLCIKLIMIISVLSVVFGFSLACANSNATTITPSPQTTSSPAPLKTFRVANMAINPAEVNAGVPALITAQVTNIGNDDSSYIGKVRIDNATKPSLPAFLYSDEVTIPVGITRILSVTTAITYPGKYKVTWDEVSQDLVVNREEPEAQNTPKNTGPVTAPDFTGVDVVTGKTVSLRQFSGSAVLLNFVNYGCNPSLNKVVSAQLLAIKKLQKQRGDFVPVSVFCGCCPPEVLRQFAKDNELNWTWILDTDNSIVRKYGNYLRKYGYPTLVFINKDQLINEVTGYTNLSSLDEKINKIAQVEEKS